MWLREPPFPRLHARFLPVLLTQIYIYYIASNGPLTQLDDRTKFSHPLRMPESRDRRASVATVFRHLERWEGLRKWRLCSQTMYRHGNMPKCVRCLGIRAVCVCVGKGRVRTHTHEHVKRWCYVKAPVLFVLMHHIWTERTKVQGSNGSDTVRVKKAGSYYNILITIFLLQYPFLLQ